MTTETNNNEPYKWWQIVLIAVTGIVLLTLLQGCKTKTIVQVEKVTQTDTLYISKVKHDSIYHRDSIFFTEYLRGDTLVQYHYNEKYYYLGNAQRDTVLQLHHDTLYINTEKVVEREPSLIDKAADIVTYMLCGCFTSSIFFLLWRIYKK